MSLPDFNSIAKEYKDKSNQTKIIQQQVAANSEN
jgi:hypothetical protein